MVLKELEASECWRVLIGPYAFWDCNSITQRNLCAWHKSVLGELRNKAVGGFTAFFISLSVTHIGTERTTGLELAHEVPGPGVRCTHCLTVEVRI